MEMIEVVRCEHCKNLELNSKFFYGATHDSNLYWCHELDRDVSVMNYCGFGERINNG